MNTPGKPGLPRTLAQRRAYAAWHNITDDAKKDKDAVFQGKYKTLARGLSAMIQVNGLAETIAFLRAKAGKKEAAKSEHRMLYNHLAEWLGLQVFNSARNPDLVSLLLQSSDSLRLATAESLAYAVWLRRFAEAELTGDDG